MFKLLALISACLLLSSCSSTTQPYQLPTPPSSAMTPLGEWELMLETNTELENAQVFGRNQELSREWRSKAMALQDYVRKVNEQD
jgi:hypothetical protein